MNIKNRLKKIEGEMNMNANYCRCDKELVIKVEPRNENGELPSPEMCADCGKEVSRFIPNYTNGIETRIVLPPYRVIEPGDESEEKRV